MAMLRRHEISDAQWDAIRDLLPGKDGDPGATAKDNRVFVNALRWIAKTGAPWRDLPERFGKWNSVFQRFNRWCKSGVFQTIMENCRIRISAFCGWIPRLSVLISMRPARRAARLAPRFRRIVGLRWLRKNRAFRLTARSARPDQTTTTQAHEAQGSYKRDFSASGPVCRSHR